MTVPYLLIDGYNLLHAWNMAQARYGPGQLQACRLQLLRMLHQRLSRSQLMRSTVVFDSSQPLQSAQTETCGELRVIYTPQGMTADELICFLLKEHPAPRQVYVVSSDREIQKYAELRGARWITSEGFCEYLDGPGDFVDLTKPQLECDKSQPPFDPELSEQWMREFGLIDVQQLEEELLVEEMQHMDPWVQHCLELQRLLNSPQLLEKFLAEDPRKLKEDRHHPRANDDV